MLLPRLLLLATSVSAAKYHMEFHHTKDWVEVGDIWLWDAFRNKAFDESDMSGLEADNSYEVNGAAVRCIEWEPDGPGPGPKDLKVRIQHSGEWGTIENVNGWEVRADLIETIWQMINEVAEESDTLYTQCRPPGYCRWGRCDTKGAVCGYSKEYILPSCKCDELQETVLTGPCFGKMSLMKVPSKMSLKIYNADNSLRADSIEVEVSSVGQAVAAEEQQCGRWGALGEATIGFMPFLGEWLDKTVMTVCRGTLKEFTSDEANS